MARLRIMRGLRQNLPDTTPYLGELLGTTDSLELYMSLGVDENGDSNGNLVKLTDVVTVETKAELLSLENKFEFKIYKVKKDETNGNRPSIYHFDGDTFISIAGVGSGGGTNFSPDMVIEDGSVSTDKTWSSSFIQSKLDNEADKSYVDEELAKKADKETVYTKIEADDKFALKTDSASAKITSVEATLTKDSSITIPVAVMDNKAVVQIFEKIANDIVDNSMDFNTPEKYTVSDPTKIEVAEGKLRLKPNVTVSGNSGAAKFNPSNDGSYINFPAHADYKISNVFTIEGWFKTPANGDRYLMNIGVNEAAILYNFGGSQALELYSPGATGDIRTGSQIPWKPDEWHHFAYIMDGSSINALVDGQPVSGFPKAKTASFNINPASQLLIGHAGGGSNSIRGSIDEFRIWNVARSRADIQANYKKQISPTSSGLVFYMNGDDGSLKDLVHGTVPATNVTVDNSDMPQLEGTTTTTYDTTKWTHHAIGKIDVSGKTKIKSFNFVSNTPVGTSILALVRFDEAGPWYTQDFATKKLKAVTGMDLTSGSALSSLKQVFTGYDVSDKTTIEIVFMMHTSNNSVTPSIDSIEVVFEGATSVEGANPSDYRVVLHPENVEVARKIDGSKDVVINVLT